MGAFTTFCGYYCALTSGVGIYFYLVLGLMEMKGNLGLKYIWNVERPSEGFSETDAEGKVTYTKEFADEYPDSSMKDKAWAFIILACINAGFMIACLICASISQRADAAAEEEEMKKAKAAKYETISQMDGDQIIS